MHHCRRWGLWLLLIVTLAAPARANDSWRVVFDFENDVIVDDDRHYTNGLFLGVVAPRDRVSPWIRKLAVVIDPFDPPANRDDPGAETDVRWGLALGHEMYTPENSALEVVDPNDRPYAGYLYVRFELARDRHRDDPSRIPVLDRLQLDLGVVGPAALARQGQRLIHDLTFSPVFRGWDNQLKNEPALTIRRSRSWRLPGEPISLGHGMAMDVVARAMLELGNVRTAGTGGLSLRAGWRLPADFGNGLFAPDDDSSEGIRLYAFAGAEFSAVARNIFLDGNTFRDSHDVEKSKTVFRAPVGLGFQRGRFRTLLSVIWNSKEFEGQRGADVFGRWSIIVDY